VEFAPCRAKSDQVRPNVWINYLKFRDYFLFICENRYASKDILSDHTDKFLDIRQKFCQSHTQISPRQGCLEAYAPTMQG